ncbi:MAG: sensor histidine kinase, partial [Spirochaetaceae bacterium]
LDARAVHDALHPRLTANVYAHVFDARREPVYLYSLGRRVPLYDLDAVDDAITARRESGRPLVPIVSEAETIGFLAADTVGFTHDDANRRFLASVTESVVTGIAVAVIVALLAAWLFASRLSRQTRLVADGLRRISAGERAVTFDPRGAVELREIGDSAARLQRQLAEEEQLRRSWMEDIAHDLRTPVTALKTQLEGVIDGYLEPTVERMHGVFDQVVTIERLVEDLRELSLVESPETTLDLEPVDTVSFVEQLIRSLYPTGSPSIRVHADTIAFRAMADRGRLTRAVSNVIDNAVEHATDGEVVITVGVRRGYAMIDVANTGWIDEAEAERYFDRLYRGDNARGRPGSGLGLPIAAKILDRHGGSIAMEQIGDRTHVRMFVPAIR